MPSHISLFWKKLAGGGIESVMLTLAEEFLAQGLDVDIVLGKRQGELVDEVPAKANVFDLDVSRTVERFTSLAKYLCQQEPDVLLSAGTLSRYAVLGNLVSGTMTPLVLAVHKPLSLTGSSSRLPKWVHDRFIRWTYPFSDRIIAVSEGVADDLASAFGVPRRDIRVIPNPVVGPRITEQAKQEVSHPWFSDDSPPVTLAVGRLDKVKGYLTLVRAFAKVRGKRPCRLVILGEGPRRPAIQQEARKLEITDDLSMTGYISNPFKYMARADVFVLSSKWEGLGNVLIETMACGTPVISTDCPGGPSEILKRGKFGRLVPVENPAALASAIEEGLNGEIQPAPLSTLERFRRDKVADQYLDVLSSTSA